MFGKNQKVPLQAIETPVLAWDEETVEHFAKSNQFNVKITSISKRQGFGMTSRDEPVREPNGHEINGVITYPKYILVTIALEKDLGEFGVWSYKLYNTSSGSENVNVPLLEFVVADPSGDIAEALHEGQMAALAAGRRYSAVQFWKREGDGAMAAGDRERGCSYESRYPLLGMYTWAELEATDLPNWAVPIWNEQFSLADLPESRHLSSCLQTASTPTWHYRRLFQRLRESLVRWMAILSRWRSAKMLFTFRVFPAAAGLVILALAVTLGGLMPEPEARTRIGEVPSVGRSMPPSIIERPSNTAIALARASGGTAGELSLSTESQKPRRDAIGELVTKTLAETPEPPPAHTGTEQTPDR